MRSSKLTEIGCLYMAIQALIIIAKIVGALPWPWLLILLPILLPAGIIGIGLAGFYAVIRRDKKKNIQDLQ